MQPVSNQYNITDKIIEANHQLYSDEDPVKRQSQPKVRFRDHKLVDYEPEDENDVNMDKKVNAKVVETNEDEFSDDGYIDEEAPEETKSIEEATEIEDVCEQIQDLDEIENNDKESSINEIYSKEDFNEEDEERSLSDDTKADQSEATVVVTKKPEKPQQKQTFRTKSSKVVPADDKSTQMGEQKERKLCCQFKESDEYKQTLPKYNGFNSNYGLSKEEIARREHVRLRQHRYKELKTIQQLEQKEMEASLNEQAFAKWYVCSQLN